uniref:I/LWEQ domain-containing protein n=1 Tax=Branchiostoma floridae TaxID=7739 RepID=C3ZGA0_BRAFL|eukprot:XP_002592410.1 hypothetical protein BRAFLDRAFT_67276 [Branchiostoma floridae]
MAFDTQTIDSSWFGARANKRMRTAVVQIPYYGIQQQGVQVVPRQNLLTAAGNIGEHGREVLHEMGEVDTDPRFQDALMALAKAVANATATLVLKAKNVASKAEDPAMQNKVIASATQTALSTSQLVACTKVVAPTISHPACQEQLIDAAKLVAKSVEKTVDSAQMATQEEFLLKDLGAAATQVTQALNDLLQHIKQASKKAKKPEKIEEPEPEELESTDDEKRDSEKSDDDDEEERRRREEEERLHRERVMGDLNTAVRNVLDQLGPEDAAVGGDLNDAVRRVMKTTSDLLNEIKFEPKPEEIEEPQVTTTVVATRESVDGGRRNEALLAELDLVVRMAMDQMSIGDDGGGSDLNDAVRRVVRRLNDLLSEIKFEAKGGEQYEDHCDTIISASDRLFASMGNASDMIKQAKILAEATSHLVNSIKTSADTTDDTDSQKRLLGAAKVLADATARMVEAAKGCAVNPHDSDEQENLRKAAEDLRAATNAAAGNAIKKKLVSKLENAAKHAAAVATQTIAASQAAASSNKNPSSQQQLVSSCKATSHLVNSIKTSADTTDDTDSQKRLLGAAKVLADATARMVEAAKGCAVNPHDSDEQENLRKAAEDLRAATNAAAGNAIKKKLVSKLENAAKHAAAVATQTIAASQAAASSNKNPSSQQQLVSSCKHVADHIPRLVQGVRGSRAQPDSPSAQLLLINASQEFISPANNMNSAAKAAVPTVSDQAASMQLSNCSKQLAQALAELRSSAQKAQDACGPLEIDSALDTIRQLDSDLVEIKKSAAEGQLVPLPDESFEGCRATVYSCAKQVGAAMAQLMKEAAQGEQCAQELGHTSKTVGASMAQLLTAAAQGNENYTGLAARDTANALRTLTGAVRGVAAATSDRQAQDHLIDTARDVMDKSINLIEEAKKAVNDPNNPDNQQRLAQVAKAVSHALNNCVNCLPGQRDVDFAIRNIGEASKALLSGQAFFRYIGHGEPYPEKPKEKPVLEMPETDFTMPERLDPQLGQTKIEERKIRPQERNLDFEAFFRHYMEEARRRMETPTVTREWVKVPGDEDLPKDTVKPNFDAFFRNYPDLEPAEQVEEKKKDREEIPTYETEDDLTIRSMEEVVRGKVEEKPTERSYIWPNFDEFFRSYPSMAKGREFGIQCNVKEEIDSPRMRKIGVLQRYRRLVRVAAKRYNLVLSSKIKVARVCKEFHLSATRLVVSVLSVFSKIDFGASSLKMEDFTIFNQHLQKGDVSFQEVQTMLSTAAQELNMASSELVVASKGTHEQLAQASGKFSKDFSLLLEAGMQMAAQTSDEEQQSLMVSNLKSISMSSSKLLLAAKSLSADPNAPNAKNQLASAARSVTDSINQLINICMQTAPGQKECDNALRNIETVTEITEVHTSSSSVETTETRKVSELKKDMEMHIVLPHPDIITKSVEVYISHFNSQTRVTVTTHCFNYLLLLYSHDFYCHSP